MRQFFLHVNFVSSLRPGNGIPSLTDTSPSTITRRIEVSKNSPCDAAERLVIFHKSCCSLEEPLNNIQHQHPYLLAVGRQKSKTECFYIILDKHLIPCQANRSLGAFDELFKAHFVLNLSYDGALLNFFTHSCRQQCITLMKVK